MKTQTLNFIPAPFEGWYLDDCMEVRNVSNTYTLLHYYTFYFQLVYNKKTRQYHNLLEHAPHNEVLKNMPFSFRVHV